MPAEPGDTSGIPRPPLPPCTHAAACSMVPRLPCPPAPFPDSLLRRTGSLINADRYDRPVGIDRAAREKDSPARGATDCSSAKRIRTKLLAPVAFGPSLPPCSKVLFVRANQAIRGSKPSFDKWHAIVAQVENGANYVPRFPLFSRQAQPHVAENGKVFRSNPRNVPVSHGHSLLAEPWAPMPGAVESRNKLNIRHASASGLLRPLAQ
jgi:hypothetical protein